MIPKVIHYCWFGRNKKSKSMLRCMESWKRYCPDYEIIEWNEDNFDINCIPFVKEAYKAEKWAFVSDYARLKVIYENGGIYLDTDVELVKSLDDLLELEAYAGIEGEEYVATGLGFGAVKGQSLIKELMCDYHSRHFSLESIKELACPIINTEVFKRYGFVSGGGKQTVAGVTLFPCEYFNPKNSQTYELNITKNTYSIHHYDATWNNKHSGIKQAVIRLCVKIIGKEGLMKLKARLNKK